MNLSAGPARFLLICLLGEALPVSLPAEAQLQPQAEASCRPSLQSTTRAPEADPAPQDQDQSSDAVHTAAVRLLATAGLGFIDTKRDVGADVPLGLALLVAPCRLLATASIADVAMVEGERDDRYYRPYLGYSYCVDRTSGQYVPSYYCSGGTEFTVASSVDLSYVVLRQVWFSDKAGTVTAGLGYRFRRPETTYATIGVYFFSRGSSAAGARLDIGSGLVHMGVIWGLDLLRLLGG